MIGLIYAIGALAAEDGTAFKTFHSSVIDLKHVTHHEENQKLTVIQTNSCPWNRIVKNSRTLLLDPIETCLASGRKKEVDSIAFEHFSKRFAEKGLSIFSPVTYRGVTYKGLEKSFADLGGSMVIKVPDSDAGQVQVGNLRSSGQGLFLCCP